MESGPAMGFPCTPEQASEACELSGSMTHVAMGRLMDIVRPAPAPPQQDAPRQDAPRQDAHCVEKVMEVTACTQDDAERACRLTHNTPDEAVLLALGIAHDEPRT